MPTVEAVIVPRRSRSSPEASSTAFHLPAWATYVIAWAIVVGGTLVFVIACCIRRYHDTIVQLRNERDEAIKSSAERRRVALHWLTYEPSSRPDHGADFQPKHAHVMAYRAHDEVAASSSVTGDDDAFDRFHQQSSPGARASHARVLRSCKEPSLVRVGVEEDRRQSPTKDASMANGDATSADDTLSHSLQLAKLDPRPCTSCGNVLTPWARLCSFCGDAQSPHMLRPPPPLLATPPTTLCRSGQRLARVAPLPPSDHAASGGALLAPPHHRVPPVRGHDAAEAMAAAAQHQDGATPTTPGSGRPGTTRCRGPWMPTRRPEEYVWDSD